MVLLLGAFFSLGRLEIILRNANELGLGLE